MQRIPRYLLIKLACIMLQTALLATGARAVELGDAVVRSHIGQPLVADIELSAQGPDEAGALRVKLAHPDVYRGANIGMHPMLSSLNMGIMRRDNRQFLHLTSIKPVDASYVHVFFELIAGERSSVRGTTLWFTQDPNPPPPPPLPQAPQVPQLPETARSATPIAVPASRAEMARPRPSFKRIAGDSFPLHKPAAKAAGPVACLPQASNNQDQGQAAACIALDARNAVLSAQIVQLENKVRVLQQTMAAKPPPSAIAALAPKAASPAAPAAPAAPARPPWMLIWGGLALLVILLGLAIFLLLRAKAKAPADRGHFMRKLASTFRRQSKQAAPPDPVEPTVD
jgi:hypothetical protein